MRLLTVVTVAAIVAAAPAQAAKIHIDYDPNYDASHVKTFSWTFTPETSLEQKSPFLHSRIVNGIEHYLTLGGFRQVDRDADVQVTYHASGAKELRFDTTHWDYGYPTGWYRSPYWGGYGGPGHSTTTVSEYTRGTLVVDVWDTASKKLVWRGTANVVGQAETGAIDKKVDKAIHKMVKKWQKIKAKIGR